MVKSMTDEILAELRTIRTLLALDKEPQLQEYMDELDSSHERVLEEFSYTEWRPLPTADLAEELDISKRTVQLKVGDLIDFHLVERRGSGSGSEYRKTGLLHAAELVTER
jgi:transcriptional antiterminator